MGRIKDWSSSSLLELEEELNMVAVGGERMGSSRGSSGRLEGMKQYYHATITT